MATTGGDSSDLEALTMPKLPLIKDLVEVIKHTKTCIDDDCRSYEEATLPCIQLTVGWSDETSDWSWQTGDDSYTGGAYFYPHWGVVDVFRRSNSPELAREIRQQLSDLCC
jgi:hypothetical protein